jgi:hypothetical protein
MRFAGMFGARTTRHSVRRIASESMFLLFHLPQMNAHEFTLLAVLSGEAHNSVALRAGVLVSGL